MTGKDLSVVVLINVLTLFFMTVYGYGCYSFGYGLGLDTSECIEDGEYAGPVPHEKMYSSEIVTAEKWLLE